MSNQDKKLDWSKFNETEMLAIGAYCENIRNKTDKPAFPYAASAFDVFSEELSALSLIVPESSIKLVKELRVMIDVLLKMSPIAPVKTPEELTLSIEEVQQNLLRCSVCFFLAKQLSDIADQITASLEYEMMKGGSNGSKH